MAERVVYSEYYSSMDINARSRYREKLGILGGISDPYLTMEDALEGLEWQDWPEVEYLTFIIT